MTRGQALLYGTLTVGTLDLLDAFVFFGLRKVPPIKILQSIASGWLGRPSYSGGMPTALLGLVSHFFIAFMIVLTYLVASRWWPVLARRALVLGPLYGIVVYCVMNYVVIPLSAAATGKPTPVVIVNGLLIHMLGIGLPAALFARAAAASALGGPVDPGTPAP